MTYVTEGTFEKYLKSVSLHPLEIGKVQGGIGEKLKSVLKEVLAYKIRQ